MMKTNMLSTLVLLSCTGLASTALATTQGLEAFSAVNPAKADARVGYAVAGIELQSANAPIANGSLGYSITLHSLVGGNSCVASQRTFAVASENDDARATTRVVVDAQKVADTACREIFAPAYRDLEGYVATQEGYGIELDTNASGLGLVTLLGRTGAVVESMEPVGIKRLGGDSGWVALTFKARAMVGTTPCFAQGNELVGYGYALDGKLHVAVKSVGFTLGRVCTMQYDPVFADVTFDVPYRPGNVKGIVVENFVEAGSSKEIALPGWAP